MGDLINLILRKQDFSIKVGQKIPVLNILEISTGIFFKISLLRGEQYIFLKVL